ncbi:DUF5777 family beta-barrel protein [Mangrovibacterium lignilyticum]|uniref:DUF5777 family beta-barrel protein n=1 Tax=Mangrovibacterium lignilyticum TaxID=2668052 RepID=UPI0013CF9E28|nr:DUF5777 family beta-barrel protein [Mangrovibacterium lignilyticum]
MKYKILFILLSLLICTNLWAQEEESDSPVTDVFAGSMIIDNQTSYIPSAKTLEFAIQHKFGTIENGHSDLWGVYSSASDIRLALNYVPVENVQIGAGISRYRMTPDFNLKWNVLSQTASNKIPVFVTLYGNMGIDGRNKDAVNGGIEFNERFSYFSQLIVGRKFTDWLSLQGAVSFSHANLVNEYYDHDRVGLHINGRIKVTPQGAILCTYDAPLSIDKISEQASYNPQYKPKPTLAFGYEISTYTHIFSIYAGNSGSILQQNTMINNSRSISKDNFAIGFTITRLWMW